MSNKEIPVNQIALIKGSELPESTDATNVTFLGYKNANGVLQTTRINLENITPLFRIVHELGNDSNKVIDQQIVTNEFAKKTDTIAIYNVSQINGVYNYASQSYARLGVPFDKRKAGQEIAYQLKDGRWIKEQYIGTSPNADEYCDKAENWIQFAPQAPIQYLSLADLSGATFSILGDSISTFRGTIPPENENGGGYPMFDITTEHQMWYGDLIYKYGMKLLVNNSYAGSEVAYKKNEESYSFCERVGNLGENPNFIFVFGGTNDFGSAVPIGDYNFGQQQDKYQFKQALCYLFDEAQRLYPTSQLIYLTPLQRGAEIFPYKVNSTSHYLAEYTDAIKSTCALYGIKVIDLSNCGITPFNGRNSQNKYLPDGLHPNTSGNKLISNQVIRNLLIPTENPTTNIHLEQKVTYLKQKIDKLSDVKGYKSLAKNIYNSNQQAVHAVAEHEGLIYLVMARNLLNLSIQLDFAQQASITRERSIGRISCVQEDGIIHILCNDAYISQDNWLDYYTYNIETKELKLVHRESFGVDMKECWSMVVFKGEVYGAISFRGYYNNGTESSHFEKSLIDLYKLNSAGTQFVKVSTIAKFSDAWGKTLTEGSTQLHSVKQTGYFRATLSVDNDKLFCTYIGTAHNAYSKFFVYTKESTDGLTWLNVDILANARCNYAHLVHYSGSPIYIGKIYTDGGFSYSLTDIAFTFNNVNKKGLFGLAPLLSEDGETTNETYNLLDLGDKLILSFSYKYKDGRNNSAIKILSIDKDSLSKRLNGYYEKDLGLLSETPSDLKIGDSFLIKTLGESDVATFVYPYVNVVRKDFASVGLDQQVRAVYNGSKFGFTVQKLNLEKDRVDAIVFEHMPQFNPYYSYAFRIPIVSDSVDGTILFATSDIRYLSGNDKDMIEVGFCRSFDGGRNWQDYTIIFYRNENADSYNRIHDCTMCVDRNINSLHYGRVHAFAKMVNTSKEEHEWADGKYVTFWHTCSDDNGLTWSNQTELTGLFPVDAYHISTGVQAGITLKDGTLVVPTYFTRNENGVKTQRASFVYSTDSETWQAGDITPSYGGENSIIQRSDGTLLMNARDAFSANSGTRRVYTLDSIGAGWINRPEYEVFKTVNVNESLANITTSHGDVFLFSQPTGYRNGKGRTNLTVFISRDLINWEVLVQITGDKGGGYSSLIFRKDKLGIIYESADYNMIYTNLDYLLQRVFV